MTIELGFAPCFPGQNLCVGIVDVPGHEKFIKTMVAGVPGIGLTVLVIAAAAGVRSSIMLTVNNFSRSQASHVGLGCQSCPRAHPKRRSRARTPQPGGNVIAPGEFKHRGAFNAEKDKEELAPLSGCSLDPE